MTDLPDFLLARFAEDEKTALAVKRVDWHLNEWTSGECAEHGDRWSPAHVLAECEAKRRHVEWAQRHEDAAREYPDLVHLGYAAGAAGASLRFLALPYADHPDYREEWRP